jgi:hypothetical protein
MSYHLNHWLARGEDLRSVDGKTFKRCHSERSEESPQLLFHRTAEILRRPSADGLLRMTGQCVFFSACAAAPFHATFETGLIKRIGR